jgi:hypothetical protein
LEQKRCVIIFNLNAGSSFMSKAMVNLTKELYKGEGHLDTTWQIANYVANCCDPCG